MITVCYVKAEIMVICCNQIKAHVHFSPEPFNHESFSSDCHGNLGLGDLCVSQDLIMLWGPKSASHRNITGASLPYIRRTARPQNLSQIKTNRMSGWNNLNYMHYYIYYNLYNKLDAADRWFLLQVKLSYIMFSAHRRFFFFAFFLNQSMGQSDGGLW